MDYLCLVRNYWLIELDYINQDRESGFILVGWLFYAELSISSLYANFVIPALGLCPIKPFLSRYDIIEQSGPSHSPEFVFTCTVGQHQTQGLYLIFSIGNPFLGKLNPLPVLDLTSYSVSSSPTREAYSQCFNTDIIFEFREVLCYYIFSRLTYSSQIANVFFPSVLSQNSILNSTAGSLLKVCRQQE